MLKSLFVILAAICSHWALAEEISLIGCKNTTQSFDCVRFLRNHDGDTFTVNIPQVHPLLGSEITVRVDGIDTAEIGGTGPCEKRAAVRAQKETERILQGARRVELKGIQRDKYFRILADVEVDGRSLGKHLLREGLAVAYDGGHKDAVDWCRR